jgi:hypothetical protein
LIHLVKRVVNRDGQARTGRSTDRTPTRLALARRAATISMRSSPIVHIFAF